MRIVLASAFLVLATAAPAHADDFDGQAGAATRLDSMSEITALFWSQSAACGKSESDFARRQCEAVRDARAEAVQSATYLVDGDAAAVSVGKFDEKKKLVEVALTSCVSCEGDAKVVVVGTGRSKGKAKAPLLRKVNQRFADAKAAEYFTTYVAPRLQSQLLVKVPARKGTFKAAGKDGFRLDVVGYRVFDPCKGTVYAASPASDSAPINVAACENEPEEPKVVAPALPVKVAPKAPVLPERLSTSQISSALEQARIRARACFDAYGIEGTASFQLVISGDGTLAGVKQSGDFVDTPTGKCVEAAMRATTFPKSKKKQTQVSYPIVLN